jgi:putative two-component system response regulator
MGIALNLSPDEITTLRRAAYLHDIGKVGIPDKILFKPGPLDPEEWEIIKGHAARGEKLCSQTRSLSAVLPAIRHHHEKWNGTGYPDGLAGEQIPLLARIIQIAEIYDALTTVRPYKRACSPHEALEILREEAAKGWRDPQLVDLLARILPAIEDGAELDLTPISLQALATSMRQHS